MASAWSLAALVPLAIWLYLVFLRGGFWRADQRLDESPPPPAAWPEVVAVVPARDEAASIAEALRSLLAQDYPGAFSVVLADDQSSDGTAAVAVAAAEAMGAADRLTLRRTEALPEGWAGKVWAMAQGAASAETNRPAAAFLLFTDADVAHPPGLVRRLVAKAEAERLDLVSLMVLLARERGWQRLLIPAFVYFFQKLYPFSWVNDPARGTAAAAGGVMLVRVAALARAGGLASIRDALIDDCALARALRAAGGRLWLGLSRQSRSLRPYDGLAGVWRMVARSAYTQLGYSPWALAGTVVGMLATYVLAPALLLGWPWHGDGLAAALALLCWALMAWCFRPTLRLYGEPTWLAPLLPLAGLLYSAMTVDSAWRHWRGRGGAWKGRTLPAGRAS